MEVINTLAENDRIVWETTYHKSQYYTWSLLVTFSWKQVHYEEAAPNEFHHGPGTFGPKFQSLDQKTLNRLVTGSKKLLNLTPEIVLNDNFESFS